MCKTLRTQNFHSPRTYWSSFGDICMPFQPSHLKNHEFHFFTKLPTNLSSYAMVHRQACHVQIPPNSKLSCTKNLMASFGDICKPFQPSHLKNHEFLFFTKLPTNQSSYVVVHRQASHVQTPPNSKLSCTKNLMVFVWGHF